MFPLESIRLIPCLLAAAGLAACATNAPATPADAAPPESSPEPAAASDDALEQDAAPAQPTAPEDCEAAADCVAAAATAREAGDLEGALTLLERACKADDAGSCHEAAIVANDDLKDPARAVPSLEHGCTLDNADSCVVLAILHVKGIGVAQDESRAAELLDKSCKLGRQDACEALEAEPEPKAKVAGANISVGSLEADGLKAVDLECRATSGGGGLFGTLGIVAGLAKSKKALDRCAPDGEAPTVFWTAKSNGLSDVRVEAVDSKTASCVKKALEKSAMPLEGECAATILIGDRAGAEKKLAERGAAG